METTAYPLTWPVGKPRTQHHEYSRFRTGLGKAIKQAQREVKLLGGRDLIISSNLMLRMDGLPYANQRQPEDAGVAVYFKYKSKPMCFACDRWRVVEDNLWAVAKTIEALRGIERWGTGSMVEQAFTGFQALPPPIKGGRPWWQVLNVSSSDRPTMVTREEAEQAFRRLAHRYHPDRGGDPSKMAELNEAIRQARESNFK